MTAALCSRIVAFGDGSGMLPLAAAIGLVLFAAGDRRRALAWLASFGAGVLLILAGKMAFDLSGLHIAALGFYSVSGHAMLTTAAYPMLLMLIGAFVGQRAASFGKVLGFALAVALAVILINCNYHTPAETLAGGAIGLIVAWFNLRTPVRLDLRRLGRRLLLLVLPLCLVAPMGLHGQARPVKEAAWRWLAHRLGATHTYWRDIETDPLSGRQQVKLVEHRKSW
ncbi:phosphatase PAP2 family protein [Ralstonia solanacearum]|uniref:phosphatase PAP2 family protein n=1 Tax=Ralstonia solanacearum TaxID=305 RepID=UPI000503CAA2|nr:phosphatase PAP2 family protein [Ralstonia solanacearum]KFX28829.1 membrane protein [Ralstonia solanacearum]